MQTMLHTVIKMYEYLLLRKARADSPKHITLKTGKFFSDVVT